MGNVIENNKHLEVINDWTKNIPFSKPFRADWRPSLVQLNDSVLMCGGFKVSKKCFIMENGRMRLHSTLNRNRVRAPAVATKSATFVFGGKYDQNSYEYLPKDSTTWILGKCDIPGGIEDACAIAIKSGQEILLFGNNEDYGFHKRILKFDVKNHTFEELPTKLKHGRRGARCAFIPGTKKIIITGGFSNRNYRGMSSTEIFDTEYGSIRKTLNPMNFRRYNHGIGIVTINDEDKLAVFGGLSMDHTNLDRIETFNTKTKKWDLTDIKLGQERYDFGYLSVKNIRCV